MNIAELEAISYKVTQKRQFYCHELHFLVLLQRTQNIHEKKYIVNFVQQCLLACRLMLVRFSNQL